jgi:hypothetical protein
VIRPDQIPPEAVKAAWQAMMAPDALAMHRAIAAAINAWPDLQRRESVCGWAQWFELYIPDEEGDA